MTRPTGRAQATDLQGKGVLVLIPAYNEEACISGVVAEVRSALPSATVVVADDGSTDGTRAVASAAGAAVLSLPFNLGVGGALRLGLRYAQRTGHEVVVQVDGDGQHDPAEVPGLIAALAQADMVIGARFAGRGEYAVRGPRRWAMVLLAAVLGRLAGTQLTDVTSGFRAFGPRAITLLAHTLPTEYLGDTVDAIVIGSRAGLRIRQQPVIMRPRQGGEPSQSPARAALYLGRAGLALLLAAVRKDRWPDLGPAPYSTEVEPT
ncbi:MAG TPA: glycosyltransferase family 2 protein [Euzebya sp.]|nr:glycosyltransferase family 2 protein [Euzebya sp.]